MTDKVNPSINRPAEAFKTAGAIAYGGHNKDGFIVEASSPTEISTQDNGIDETQFTAFQQSSNTSSHSVDIRPGEAFVFGSWVAIDVVSTITLASNTSSQTVYVGWNKGGTDDVIIGPNSAFDDASGDTDKRIPLWEFDTDGSGVVNVTDRRTQGQSLTVNEVSILRSVDSGRVLEIDTENGMIASGPFTLNGELRVDGSFRTTDSISGSGSITGTGTVKVI